jgi:hypothetical protein
VEFADTRFSLSNVKTLLETYNFYNGRPITKSMLAWWAFQNPAQSLLSLETTFEIEHIFARNRQEKEPTLQDARHLEWLGNKSLLEKRINIRASDYRFEDKIAYYRGGLVTKRRQHKEGTSIDELLTLAATATDFTETDILARNEKIIQRFLAYIQENELSQ